jgi:hypothetical protein
VAVAAISFKESALIHCFFFHHHTTHYKHTTQYLSHTSNIKIASRLTPFQFELITLSIASAASDTPLHPVFDNVSSYLIPRTLGSFGCSAPVFSRVAAADLHTCTAPSVATTAVILHWDKQLATQSSILLSFTPLSISLSALDYLTATRLFTASIEHRLYR